MPEQKQQVSRIEHILELASDPESAKTFGLLAAYCYCLTPKQACELLVQIQESPTALRNSVLRKVCNDIDQSYSLSHENLIQRLLANFSQADFRGRQGLGYCLSILAEHIPAIERRAIQRVFLQSKYVGVRKRAYKSLSTDRKVPHTLVHDAWIKFQDPGCAWLIVKTSPVDYLIQHCVALAAAVYEGWQLARLYLRMGKANQRLLKELKSMDQITYCYVVAKLGLKLSAREARTFVDGNSGDERFGLLVWSLGRLGLWDALQYVQARIPAIHEQELAGLRERYGI